MNLYQQYIENSIIEIKINKSIEYEFIMRFVEEYKLLLSKKKQIGDSFLEEEKTLKISFKKFYLEDNEDFDLTFISYLTLFKIDFSNVIIQFHFTTPSEEELVKFNSTTYKLIQHKTHLQITSKLEIFKIFIDNTENKLYQSLSSASYLPILLINKETLTEYFAKKTKFHNYQKELIGIINSLTQEEIIKAKDLRSLLTKTFLSKKENYKELNSYDLSILYLFRFLEDIQLLEHFINRQKGITSDYNIGRSIMESETDSTSSNYYRTLLSKTIEVYGIFKLSDIEIYFLSIITSNSKLFKIPNSLEEMRTNVRPFLSENDITKIEKNNKFLREKFIEILNFNLKKIISYTNDICFGLEELAKNIVEHSGEEKNSGFGTISGRVYDFDIIKKLKSIDVQWLKNYNSEFKFLDVNVIDSGKLDIVKAYQRTIEGEKNEIINNENNTFENNLIRNYNEDIKKLEKYALTSLFNYDSLNLFHQINRTKAKIGLLIFSQTILHEKKAFVTISSNSLDFSKKNNGYYLYSIKEDSEKGNIERKENPLAQPIGTYYNFIIPFDEKLTFKKENLAKEEISGGTERSVFIELFDYLPKSDSKFKLKRYTDKTSYEDLGKYEKLIKLKKNIGTLNNNYEILVLDFKNISNIVQNSSDCFRFFSDLQFSLNSINDIIILNFETEMYIEFIQILKLFSNKLPFWKNDRFILFFFPIKRNEENDIFWFNHILYSDSFKSFLKLNEDIDRYHQNLSRIIEHNEDNDYKSKIINYNSINSKLFSTSGKLQNFELLIENEKGISLFEENLKSMLNTEIQNQINEN